MVLKLNKREEGINATIIISMLAWEELALTARPVTDTDQCKCQASRHLAWAKMVANEVSYHGFA